MMLSTLALLLPFGCSGKDDTSGEESDTDTDSDTDSDTDTDADTDTVPECKGTFTDARDGRVYKQAAMQAGGGPTGDCWMAENLDYGEFLLSKKGDMTDNKIPEKYCYDDDEDNCATLGALYQWAELMDYAPSDNKAHGDTQGLCPIGWHLPTDEEWKLLEYALGMRLDDTNDDGWRGKAISPQLMLGAVSGYDATLTGWYDGDFNEQGEAAKYWMATAASTDTDENHSWDRELENPEKNSLVGRFDESMDHGLSARCVRNAGIE
jgi:uncharacterized protein (TIGR02145 family)